MATQALPAGYGLQEYRIERLLGVGGFGLTYLALDENLNLKVALKEYMPGDLASRTADQSITPSSDDTIESFRWGKRRFLDESRTLASFRHPNIVRVMRFFEANGSAYMVMEFVEGAPLSEWIKSQRPLSEAYLRAFLMPLLDGLEVVHQAGYTHRDIKPGNIYMREDLTPVLLDFGSARLQASEHTAVVSPGFAPFEQYHTQGNQGPWSDLYALGGVLYWMVTGTRPHDAIARAREDGMPSALQCGDRDVYGVELLAAIDWALTPLESERPQSVAEWREALLGITDPKVVKLERAKAQLKAQPAPKVEPAPPPPPKAPVFDPGLIKKLETRLAQYLGPIAKVIVGKAAKKAGSETELISLLSAEILEPGEHAAFEKSFSEVSRQASQPLSGAPGLTNPATSAAASRFPLEVLARAERLLAQHIGAVARVVVKRAAMKARDDAELYLLLSQEIEDKDDRKAFIRQAAK